YLRRHAVARWYHAEPASPAWICYLVSAALLIASGAIGFTFTVLAGTPAMMWYGRMSLVATPIEPSRPCSPALTPLLTVARYVMRAFGPISVFSLVIIMGSLRSCACE